jgi:hypothetical protein
MVGKRFVIPLIAVVGAICTAAPADAAAITVRFVPAAQVVNLGDVVVINVVADIDAGSAIVSWGIDVGLSSAILGGPAVAIGALFSSTPPAGDMDGLIGIVVPPDPPVSGVGIVLATLTYTATSLGTTNLIASITGGDALEGFFQVGGGAVTDLAFVNGVVTVIPLPPALLLGAAGLGLVGIARRRKLA